MGLCERISGGTWCRREAVGRERGDKGGGSTWNHTTILIYVRGESDDGGVPVPGAGRCSGRRVEVVEGRRRRGLCILRDWCLKEMHFQGLDFALKPLFVGSLPLQKRPWRTASLPCNVLPLRRPPLQRPPLQRRWPMAFLSPNECALCLETHGRPFSPGSASTRSP